MTSKASPKERMRAARAFADAWAGQGNEKQDSRTFWLGVAQEVLGMGYAEFMQGMKFEHPVRLRNTTGFVDVYMPDARVVVEQKSLGVDLDKPEERRGALMTPFQQALSYADAMEPGSVRFVVVCDFGTFRVHDLESCPRERVEDTYREFTLDELGSSPDLLGFIVDPANSRSEAERDVSVEAGRVIGELYDGLRAQYLDPDSPESLHALNVLCVRLVFCLFCEDAGLFGKDAFLEYLRKVEPENMRAAIKELFAVLDTPEDGRDPYLPDKLASFPYVNGGLFTEDTEVPNFTTDLKYLLLSEASRRLDWSTISPTVFGGIFESTLNPQTRATGGMHYTSPENIHKVIDPLFLDDLYREFDGIVGQRVEMPRSRNRRLRAFRDKIGSLRFLDPACGSGNFLTEAYLSLRALEDDVLAALRGGQAEITFDEEDNERRVSLDQFHGIEINDFACRVARTALWIARLQANNRTEMTLDVDAQCFPLRESAHIVCANALRTDWNDVLPATACDYVMGNPPFLGARNQSKEQKAEVMDAFRGAKNCGNVDYVAGWYAKAADYMAAARDAGAAPPHCAFVSTNSICQGEQVANVWQPLQQADVGIDFAHDTFRWSNEADEQAHVFVVVVGFSLRGSSTPKRLFHHEGPDADAVESRPSRINAYLADAPDVLVANRTRPLCKVPEMGIGSQPIDGGNYLFKPDEMKAFLAEEPAAAPYFHRFMGSNELINGRERYVLWLGELKMTQIRAMPLCNERVKAVRAYRKASKRVQTQKAAKTPNHFGTEIIAKTASIAVPEVSSERRHYVPMGFVGPEVFCSNKIKLVPNATLYHFGVLCSQVHNAWMRRVCGRLKSDYSYSNTIVYNNFPWPGAAQAARERGLAAALATSADALVSTETRQRIEACAQAVLDARGLYEDATLADLYDPDNADDFPELMAAHAALDAAVEGAYGMPAGLHEDEVVARLMALYAQLTAGE